MLLFNAALNESIADPGAPILMFHLKNVFGLNKDQLYYKLYYQPKLKHSMTLTDDKK